MPRLEKVVVFFLAWLLTLSIATRWGIAQEQPRDAADLFARAVRLHQAGDVEAAAGLYQSFLLIHPNNVEALSNLGAAFARLGRYAEAIDQYQRALASNSDTVAVRFNLGVAHYKAAQIPEASTELATVLAAQPGNLNAAILLGDCHLRMGANKKAIELLSPLEAANKENRTLLYVLGTALIRDKQVAKGQLLVDQILRHGDSAEARMMLGTAHLIGRDYRGALKEFERALELNPKLPTANSLYGKTLLSTANRDQAREAFLRELELNPVDFVSNFSMGVLLKQDRKSEEALGYLQRALELHPGAAEVRYQIGSLHVATGSFDEAQRVLEELVRDEPKFVAAHVSLATVYYRLNRKQDGDRHREIIRRLNAAIQAEAPGGREGLGPSYQGEGLPEIQTIQGPLSQ